MLYFVDYGYYAQRRDYNFYSVHPLRSIIHAISCIQSNEYAIMSNNEFESLPVLTMAEYSGNRISRRLSSSI